MLSSIKQVEVDERIEPDDQRVLAILDKMVKQRKDSITQFTQGGRQELADKEQFEINVIQEFMPAQLSEAEIDNLIATTLSQTGATSIKDMGKVMAIIKPQVQGRADMGLLSGKIKSKLS